MASLGRPVSDFAALAADLGAAGYHVTAVNVRGVGESDLYGNPASITLYDLADDALAAMQHDGLRSNDKIVIIGHAFGNRLARAFAHKYPQRVRGIVLLAAGGAQNIQEDPRVWKALMQSFDLQLPEAERHASIRYAFFAGQNVVPPQWLEGWYSGAAHLCIAAVQNTPESEWRGGDGKSPMLVIQAENDRIAPPELTSLLLKKQFPNRVTIVNIEGAGHALLPEQPEAIKEAVIAFLQDLP